MPLKLYRRDGFWHYRGTIGPPERRARLRGTTGIEDKKGNRSTAQRHIAEIEARYWKGYQDGPSAVLTFEEACVNYLAAGKSDRFLPPVRKYLGTRLVKDIKPSTLKQMAMELFPGNSGASRNRRALTPAQAVINHNAEAELCSPMLIKTRFKEFKKVKHPASLEWVQSFSTTASAMLAAYALFMFLTGCRPSEGLAIDRDRDIDLNAATAIISNGKVGHERIAHLPKMLVAAIRDLEVVPGRPLFWYESIKVVRWPWDQAIKRAGIKRLTMHCCRHGAVTYLLRSGIDVVTVGKLVDMSPEMVMKNYGHAIDDRTLTDRLTDTPLTRALSEVVEKAAIAIAS